MNEKNLELLERIKDTLSEIQDLREDLGDLLGNPDVTLENLGRLRDTLAESCYCTISQVCAEARAVFSELFTGRNDREIVSEIAGIVRRAEMKDAPAGAANTGEGGAEQSLTAVSASHDTRETEEMQPWFVR